MPEPTTLPLRTQVPLEEIWALDSIFPTPADWEVACQELDALLP
jgi:hypothetical protein